MTSSLCFWAAIKGRGDAREIMCVGALRVDLRFDRQIFRGLGGAGGLEWIAGGAQYCKLYIDAISDVPLAGAGGAVIWGTLLRDYPHGRVRKSRITASSPYCGD